MILTVRPLRVLCLVSVAAATTHIVLPADQSSGLPFLSVQNLGQAEPRVRYTGTEFKAWFLDRSVILQQRDTRVQITFAGKANGASPVIEPESRTGAKANYLRGSDSHHWPNELPRMPAIKYQNVWPGVELTYQAEESGVEAEYVVVPGDLVDQIRLRFDSETSGAGGQYAPRPWHRERFYRRTVSTLPNRQGEYRLVGLMGTTVSAGASFFNTIEARIHIARITG